MSYSFSKIVGIQAKSAWDSWDTSYVTFLWDQLQSQQILITFPRNL